MHIYVDPCIYFGMVSGHLYAMGAGTAMLRSDLLALLSLTEAGPADSWQSVLRCIAVGSYTPKSQSRARAAMGKVAWFQYVLNMHLNLSWVITVLQRI
jgi:hypothetical protein